MNPIYARALIELTVIIVIPVILFWRNILVYNYGIGVLYSSSYTVGECVERYDRLPSYGRMFVQWWRCEWTDYLEGKRKA